MKKIIDNILNKIKMGEEISPFLFLGENLELLNEKVNNIAFNILGDLDIPKVNIFKLEDNGEIIKLEQIKTFLKISDSKTPYKIQILIIENFSRANLQASNSCLKKFEEPGIKNIYFLTNASESGIIETILSRVQVVNIKIQKSKIQNNFYYNLINEVFEEKNIKNILNYFFNSKLEKEDYINFLETLIIYSKKKYIFINYLEEIFDDLNMVKTNNLLPKITIDKWLLRIINDSH